MIPRWTHLTPQLENSNKIFFNPFLRDVRDILPEIALINDKKLRHGRSTCEAKVRKRYASLLLPSPQILEDRKTRY